MLGAIGARRMRALRALILSPRGGSTRSRNVLQCETNQPMHAAAVVDGREALRLRFCMG